MNHNPDLPDREPTGFWRSRHAIGFLVLAAVAAYFLLSEHRAHFFQALPFLLLLACPLMHVFMHRGHGGHAGGPVRTDGDKAASTSAAPAAGTGAQP